MTSVRDRLGDLAATFAPDLRAWFADDPGRAARLTFSAADLVVDLSKGLVDDEVLDRDGAARKHAVPGGDAHLQIGRRRQNEPAVDAVIHEERQRARPELGLEDGAVDSGQREPEPVPIHPPQRGDVVRHLAVAGMWARGLQHLSQQPVAQCVCHGHHFSGSLPRVA